MKKEMKMPQLGESVTEGTINKWLVAPGDTVQKYEPIAEVVTDKVNAEIPSSFTGVIKELFVQEDDTVAVGTLICSIEVESEQKDDSVDSEKEAASDTQNEGSENKESTKQDQSKRYSPAVLKMASEHGIQLEDIEGTGKGGRITRKDVQQIIDKGDQKQPTSIKNEDYSPTKEVTSKHTVENSISTAEGDLAIPLTPIRKAIAANMVRSKQEAPHAWMMIEVDVTNLVNFRNKVKASFKEKEGINLTYLPFFTKAIVEALKVYPQMNSMWAENKIIQKRDINLSLAVATEEALFVPVIKAADEKTVKGLAREINDLATKVRKGTLQSADVQGGTFTVNNTGAFGSVLSTPIINFPQAAILSIESIVKRPVVLETDQGDMIAIRSMVNLCLSIDHRVLDGLICGKFLAQVKENLEKINEDHTSIY
ncbi:dihydrolipoamide acetyltransferase family protein [Alkalihalobacillus trypoxylicola]|uniref:Dihydrolipoamide acetyltransferase component of pyruvate dehydrogenase complex n=1 Tax=Alkalihalobacillus trypoxylicola TaxID=519424 RepID=A0A161Q0U5_9BACI|nr:dihydrolipoamide acetyltransferase family protein [Alkalihalobacillus trypoxylicola]KYG29084.1 branched-chain alpha-keto acid dehydrogenase subunit E2 [Alkalihalobacillus trypoxylicola]